MRLSCWDGGQEPFPGGWGVGLGSRVLRERAPWVTFVPGYSQAAGRLRAPAALRRQAEAIPREGPQLQLRRGVAVRVCVGGWLGMQAGLSGQTPLAETPIPFCAQHEGRLLGCSLQV